MARRRNRRPSVELPLPPPRPRWGLAAMFLACACMVAVVNSFAANSYRALATRGLRTEAVIMRIEISTSHRPGPARPVFAFAQADGREVEGRPLAQDSAGQLLPGQCVLVIYDPQDPTHAQSADSFDTSGPPTRWVFDLMALFFVAGAIMVVVRPRPG